MSYAKITFDMFLLVFCIIHQGGLYSGTTKVFTICCQAFSLLYAWPDFRIVVVMSWDVKIQKNIYFLQQIQLILTCSQKIVLESFVAANAQNSSGLKVANTKSGILIL